MNEFLLQVSILHVDSSLLYPLLKLVHWFKVG